MFGVFFVFKRVELGKVDTVMWQALFSFFFLLIWSCSKLECPSNWLLYVVYSCEKLAVDVTLMSQWDNTNAVTMALNKRKFIHDLKHTVYPSSHSSIHFLCCLTYTESQGAWSLNQGTQGTS